jgi:hypothetical protein
MNFELFGIFAFQYLLHFGVDSYELQSALFVIVIVLMPDQIP